MNLVEGLKAAFSLLSSIFIVILVCSLGWFLVYKFFLLRFKVVRELLGQLNDNSSIEKANEPKVKSRKVRRE
ncbi:hypothetical protein PVAND_002650 [Polypedilum vanderplanki]|uniref:Uncharacterized protein n=1 Tax=Polypedilum vanderplanki TaxID=319348 RepID=A0A9J6BRT6_POLVA|nr:hypothetical protein PVAND_002650 [Polypedilum vanderplanki]